MVERWTISVPDELAQEFNDIVDLGHGDNRSQYVQTAIREYVEKRTGGSPPETRGSRSEDTDPESPEPAETSVSDPEPTPDDLEADVTTNELETIDGVVDDVSSTWNDDRERIEKRRAAARAALIVCAREGSLGRAEAIDDHNLKERYPVGGQNDRTWWRKNIRPVLQEAGEYSQGAHGYVVDFGE